MRRGISQERNEREQLNEGARPAVAEDQRDALAAAGPFVYEVDAKPVDLRETVSEAIELALTGPPVNPLTQYASSPFR